MTFLRLTNTHQCLELAKALVGSEVAELGRIARLICVVTDRICHYDASNLYLCDSSLKALSYEKEILLPIDKIKIDPWLAAKYGVVCNCRGSKGIIRHFSKINGEWNFICPDYPATFCSKEEYITLDLEWAATLPGASIVEVK